MKKIAEKLKKVTKHLHFIKYAHTGAGKLISDIEKSFDELFSERELRSIKDELNELLLKEKRKIYITIDDIDRLTPLEIVEIFQLVKLNGNFANTTYLLSYDAEVVNAALKSLYQENGHRYIEKIVQIDYSIPRIFQEDLINVFESKIKGLFDQNLQGIISESIKDFKKEKFTSFFDSIRDIIRFLNALELRLPSIYNELSIQDFCNLEALRVFDPKAYDLVFANKEKLVIRYRAAQIGHASQQEREQKEELIDSFDVTIKSKKVIKELFGLKGIEFHSYRSSKKLVREKRIAQPNYFDRYFNLRLSSADLDEGLFQSYLNGDTCKRLEVVEKVKSKNAAFEFFNWLGFKMERGLDDDYYRLLLTDSLKTIEYFEYQGGGLTGYEGDFVMVLNMVSSYLERIRSPETKLASILEFIDTPRGTLNMSALIVTDSVISAHEKHKINELYSNLRWYELFNRDIDSTEFIKRVKIIFKREVRKHFKDLVQSFEKYNSDEIDFLFSNILYQDKKLYNELTPQIFESVEHSLDLVAICAMKRVVSGTSGTGFCLARSSFYIGFSPENVYQKLQEMEDLSNLDEIHQKTAKFFIHVYDNGLKEGEYYDIDW